MSVLTSSWRCSLAATALWAVLGSNLGQAVAQEQPGKSQPTAVDREKLGKELRAMKEKADQLEKEGKHEEAEHLKREAREMYMKMKGSSEGRHMSESSLPSAECDKIREQLEQLKQLSQRIGELEKAGRHDEAAHVKQEAQALHAKLHAGGPSLTANPQGNPIREKLQHMRVAAEHLKAAGLEPEAQHVMQMFERLQKEASGQAGRSSIPPGASNGPSREYANPMAVRELQGQLEQMRREMREMREQLNHVKDQGERK